MEAAGETAVYDTMKRPLFLMALLVFLFSSCATTKLTAVWEAPNFHGTIRKIVVTGTFRTPVIRNLFEDDFVNRLKDYGVEAVASYTIIPIDKVQDKDYVMKRIKETGADAVLMTRLIDKKTERTYVPGTVYTVPNYYRRWGYYYDYIYSPGYTVDEEYAYAETNIYTLSNEEMIWSARSRTVISGTDENLIKAFVKTISDRLSADGVI